MSDPEARLAAALRKPLMANGVDHTANQGYHGWRCEHPDRYGPCDCFDEMVKDVSIGAIAADPTIARHMALGAAVERVFAYAGNGYDYISVTKHADRMDDGYEPSPNDRWSIESGLVTLRGTGPTLTDAIDAALRDPKEAERE